MANTCTVYGNLLSLHRVSNSLAKLSNLQTRNNSKKYLK